MRGVEEQEGNKMRRVCVCVKIRLPRPGSVTALENATEY